MGFKVNELETVTREVEVLERLWVTADGKRLVADGDPAAATLFSTPGTFVSRAEAERFGLVKKPAAKKPAAKGEG